MQIETAPLDPAKVDSTCDHCGAENTYVEYDHDTVCSECGHVPTPSLATESLDTRSEWEKWWEHRREEDYEGWYGEDRVKFVGSFTYEY